jgi:hypothetical protein
MLEQALRLIQETANQAANAQILEIDDPRVVHVRLGDALTMIAKTPPLRAHQANSVESFCAIVAALPLDGDGRNPTVWHSPEKLHAAMDDSDRRDTVTCKLVQSREYETLKRIDRDPLLQKEFCKLLKLDLGVPETFIGQFRRLDWASGNDASGETRRGVDKMGVSIRSEVAGIDQLPDTLVLQIPLYSTDGARMFVPIECMIEIDPDPNRRSLTLATKPGATEAALHAVHRQIADTLAENLPDTPVFYGSM